MNILWQRTRTSANVKHDFRLHILNVRRDLCGNVVTTDFSFLLLPYIHCLLNITECCFFSKVSVRDNVFFVRSRDRESLPRWHVICFQVLKFAACRWGEGARTWEFIDRIKPVSGAKNTPCSIYVLERTCLSKSVIVFSTYHENPNSVSRNTSQIENISCFSRRYKEVYMGRMMMLETDFIEFKYMYGRIVLMTVRMK